MEETVDITLSELAAIVIKGFESNDRKFTALAEDISEIRETMATKQDIASVRKDMATKADIKDMATKQDIARIENTMATASELSILRHDVEIIKADTESNKGFSKEIDHVLSRVMVIEKHIGLVATDFADE